MLVVYVCGICHSHNADFVFKWNDHISSLQVSFYCVRL